MKTLKILFILFLSITVSNCSNSKKEQSNTTGENLTEVVKEKPEVLSLYQRLGEEEGISSIVDDIVDAHLNNPVIMDVFLPLKDNPDHFEAFKKHVKEFLSAGTGGSAVYTGKDLPSAHAGLKTTEKQYLAAVDDILLVLTNHGIDEESKKDMLFILYSLKGAVIGK